MISRFLPKFYKGVFEFDVLMDSEQPLFNDMYSKYAHALTNQFIVVADEDGLERFEEMLGIEPEGDLEERRAEILSTLHHQRVYNVNTYTYMLGRLFPEFSVGFHINPFDHESYLGIALFSSAADDDRILSVIKVLLRMLPLNMKLTVKNNFNVPYPEAPLYVSTHTTYMKCYSTTAGD